ncbi:hypothetical protein IMY05_C4479000800 [Salix suchowensis]|nr:hypothetical protein IMY05_C4479000800 [Salix suchowensis]
MPTRVLCYDPTSALLLLVDKETALLVDVSLCVDRWSGPWLRERLAIAMIIGHLETLEVRYNFPQFRDIDILTGAGKDNAQAIGAHTQWLMLPPSSYEFLLFRGHDEISRANNKRHRCIPQMRGRLYSDHFYRYTSEEHAVRPRLPAMLAVNELEALKEDATKDLELSNSLELASRFCYVNERWKGTKATALKFSSTQGGDELIEALVDRRENEYGPRPRRTGSASERTAGIIGRDCRVRWVAILATCQSEAYEVTFHAHALWRT